MTKTAEGFETTVQVLLQYNLNLAFRYCVEHWNNNSGQNYTFEVQSKNHQTKGEGVTAPSP